MVRRQVQMQGQSLSHNKNYRFFLPHKKYHFPFLNKSKYFSILFLFLFHHLTRKNSITFSAHPFNPGPTDDLNLLYSVIEAVKKKEREREREKRE